MSLESLKSVLGCEQKLLTRRRIIVIVVVLAVAWASYAYISHDQSLAAKLNQHFATAIIAGIFAIVTSLLASVVFYFLMDHRKENSVIAELKDLAPPEYLRQLFEELHSYKKISREDVTVHIELLPSGESEKFLICKMRKEYKQTLSKKYFSFEFNLGGQHLDQIRDIPEDALDNDFIMGFDESDYPDGHVPSSDLYNLNNLIVDALELYPIKGEQSGVIFKESPISRRWQIPVPREKLKRKVSVVYEVTFPVELESFIVYTHDYPTKGFSIGFDPRQVADRLNTAVTHSSGLVSEPQKISSHSTGGRHFFVSTTWHAPTDLFCFMWWTKK